MQPAESAKATLQVSEIPNPPVSSILETDQTEEKEKLARISRYSSPEFTRKLLEHMRLAVKTAIFQVQQRPNQ